MGCALRCRVIDFSFANRFHISCIHNKKKFDTRVAPEIQQKCAKRIYSTEIPQETPCSFMGSTALDFWGDARWFNGNPKMVVVGHRGCGKNNIGDPRPSIMENTITSFNMAAANGADFVEFDVQVTKDGHAVIFHDDLIITEDHISKKIGELTLDEFLSIGFRKDREQQNGKALLRRAKDGSLHKWTANVEDSLCTLKQAFEQVYPYVGFNIEIKLHDTLPTSPEEMARVVSTVIKEVRQYANGRKLYFSSFHPDAVEMLSQIQQEYPIFFLTDGGVHIFEDTRRNSIEAAVQVCKKCNLHGIVSEVKAVLNDANAVAHIKEAGLQLLTYGELNNVTEAVHKQEELGVDGVIVDHVPEIVAVVRKLDNSVPLAGVEPLPTRIRVEA